MITVRYHGIFHKTFIDTKQQPYLLIIIKSLGIKLDFSSFQSAPEVIELSSQALYFFLYKGGNQVVVDRFGVIR